MMVDDSGKGALCVVCKKKGESNPLWHKCTSCHGVTHGAVVGCSTLQKDDTLICKVCSSCSSSASSSPDNSSSSSSKTSPPTSASSSSSRPKTRSNRG
jgi:hypothetical protein